MLDTLPQLQAIAFPAMRRGPLHTLQVNLGYRCNLQCQHCHVNAGPRRTEALSDESVEALFALLEMGGVNTLDLTGGAPELHPRFREIVERARALGLQVMERSNLCILEEPGQETLAEFLAANGVEVIASLPCYLQENVDTQRGDGTFEASIRGLRRLNALGYGSDSDKQLNLVFNPQGAVLPPGQAELETDYKKQLHERYGIRFNRLFTITNMPIKRFGSTLLSRGEFDGYMQLLQENFQPQNIDGVMCRGLLSVDWRGQLYDCDFNQMLELPLDAGGEVLTLATIDLEQLEGRPIRVAGHCYGCTAGQGSSCGGAL